MLKQHYPPAIPVSARTGEGLSRLAAAVSDALTHHFLDVDIETDVANGRLLACAGEERRDSQPHVHRRSRFGPLPHAAQVPGAALAGRSAHSAAQQRPGFVRAA